MALCWVTGLPGTGKSTIIHELQLIGVVRPIFSDVQADKPRADAIGHVRTVDRDAPDGREVRRHAAAAGDAGALFDLGQAGGDGVGVRHAP